jgi:hypothetical protein
LATELSKQEKTFVTDAAFLFLNLTPTTTTETFGSSTHGDIVVRYLNVSSQPPLSIDYTIVKNQLVIATSKNTMWSIIDKLFSTPSLTQTDPGAADTLN